MVSFGVSFARETWSLFGVGVLAVACRVIARVRRLGWRGLQGDDALMFFALVWYTILCVSLNEVASGGGSNLMTPEDVAALTPETKEERIRGSKWVFVSEHAMVLTIWSLKFCLLSLYFRITDGLQQRNLVIFAGIYAILTLIGTEFALFFACRPLAYYWAVPTPDYQCSSYQHYEIAQGALSISSDVLILVVGMPILIAVRLPKRQKMILLFLFGLGGFVIVAAILTKIYCLVPSLISYVYMNWYFREATVAVLVTNLPLTWSLIRDVFPGLKKWANGESNFRAETWPESSRHSSKKNTVGSHERRSRGLNLHSFAPFGWNEKEFENVHVTESREGFGHRVTNEQERSQDRSIHVQSDVTIDEENASEEEGGYPVWNWHGNPQHVSSTEVAGGAGRL